MEVVQSSLAYIIAIMQSLDRLFGRQISNLPQLPQLHKPTHKPHLRSLSFTRDELKPLPRQTRESLHPQNSTRISSKPKPHKEPPAPSASDLRLKLTDYFDEAMGCMLTEEGESSPMGGYIGKSDISGNMRTILLDWLLDVHLKFKMFPQTLFIVAGIIDRYLTIKHVRKEELQLVGAASLFIAAKYEETYQVPDASELVSLSAKVFTKTDLLRMEADIMEKLNFNLIFNTSYHFLSPLIVLANYDLKKASLAQYVLELALLDHRFLHHKGSLLAAATVYLINKIKRVETAWSDQLVAASGYEEKELRSCAKQLCHLMEGAQSNVNTKCLRRKFSLPKFAEVARIKLQKRDKHAN